MNQVSFRNHGRLLRGSLAIPLVIAASLPSVAQARPAVPAQEPEEQASPESVETPANVTPVMFPVRPFRPPFFPRPFFPRPFFPFRPFFPPPFFVRPVVPFFPPPFFVFRPPFFHRPFFHHPFPHGRF